MIQSFCIDQSLQYPNYKITESDEDPESPVTPSDIKMAQSMAGALLWFTKRRRPDIAASVASACRLATKNPRKSIEISTVVMQYVRGNPGGLHYPKGVPEETWGMRNQLKVERAWQAAGDLFRYLFLVRAPVIEVFKDLLRSLLELLRHGSHRSKPSSPTARRSRSWLLIDYCEGLNAGRSMEAMICAMIKEPMGQSTVERVIYGDNAAAIAVAQRNGTSSWRTRIFEYVPHF